MLLSSEELVRAAADRVSMAKAEAKRLLDAYAALLQEALARGDQVRITGLGTFEAKPTAARQGRNPQTGAVLAIEAGHRVAFKPGKILKDAVNNRRAA